jgi:hypothetical protein
VLISIFKEYLAHLWYFCRARLHNGVKKNDTLIPTGAAAVTRLLMLPSCRIWPWFVSSGSKAEWTSNPRRGANDD